MKRPPASALLSESQIALFADYYELTMAQADITDGNNATCTANYFVRSIPQGDYLIVAGLEQVIHYILNLRFSDADLAWLRESQMVGNMSGDFVDYLCRFKFEGDIYAVPEGTPVFANEPLINVTGPTIDVQIFETYLLSVMNFQTLIATKTSRMIRAARGSACFDFGARRAHGRDAGILAARASFIGGAAGTSLVIAGRYFDIPCVGTVAHKFIQDRPSELEAFRAYAKAFPNNTVLLIDTYDTIQGAKIACHVGKEMELQGYRLKGVRLDSGDLLKLSQEVRSILDAAGLTYVQIFASGDLDEFKINQLMERNAPIDGFGIGTRLATGANFNPLTGEGAVSALPGVYKHVERIDGSAVTPTIKLSDEPGKSTLPARKQVYRFHDAGGCYEKDLICLWGESCQEGEGLLVPIVNQGKSVYYFPSLKELQARATEELTKLPDHHKRFTDGEAYPVELSPQLEQLQRRLSRESKSVPQN
ncbi:MAG: nicotinate phosphoribosyltransferase [Candidatus Poribacteria bacterium]|nr:nicotinate phosphoribosyltransferase [Candidatus Poribacteria bacterium]MDE0505504.1 nicotinate phosphoribosyltransferase [Candidatus Poribacteria bacterium]